MKLVVDFSPIDCGLVFVFLLAAAEVLQQAAMIMNFFDDRWSSVAMRRMGKIKVVVGGGQSKYTTIRKNGGLMGPRRLRKLFVVALKKRQI